MKLPFKIDLNGKVAAVTGGTGVLCSVLGESLAKCGAKVALIGRNEEKAMKIAEEFSRDGAVVKGYSANVLNREELEKVKEKINKELGSIDILINGAGGNNPAATTDDEYFNLNEKNKVKDFFQLDEVGVRNVFNLNFLGTLIPTQVFAKDMLNKDDASIINISSMNAYTPLTKIPAYSGAKAAVTNFTQWLATYFSRTNIRCNAIAPGFFATEQNRKLLFHEDGSPTARTGKILSSTPKDRFGEAEELVGALLFLVSKEAASFVTGICIPVDGGFSAYSGV